MTVAPTDAAGRRRVVRVPNHLADAVPREALRGHHRINQYRLLLGKATGAPARLAALSPPERPLER